MKNTINPKIEAETVKRTASSELQLTMNEARIESPILNESQQPIKSWLI